MPEERRKKRKAKKRRKDDVKDATELQRLASPNRVKNTQQEATKAQTCIHRAFNDVLNELRERVLEATSSNKGHTNHGSIRHHYRVTRKFLYSQLTRY